MRKEVINFNENPFVIKGIPSGNYGLFIIKKNGREHMLSQNWTISECKEFIHKHFIGEKGTKLNLTVIEAETAQDENGHLYKQEKGE